MLREFDYENLPIVDIVNEILVDAIKKMPLIFILTLMNKVFVLECVLMEF